MKKLTRAGLAEAERYLRRNDRGFALWMDRVGPVSLRRQTYHFGALCRTIIAQQLAAAAAKTIHRRFMDLFCPSRFPRPAQVLEAKPAELRACGLSQRKMEYLLALAKAFHTGPLRGQRLGSLSDDEVRELLLPLPGIGLWSVEMFLIFSLGRPDIFSVRDLALCNGVQRVEGRSLPPEKIEKVAERWAPYRSVASLYLWKIAHWRGE